MEWLNNEICMFIINTILTIGIFIIEFEVILPNLQTVSIHGRKNNCEILKQTSSRNMFLYYLYLSKVIKQRNAFTKETLQESIAKFIEESCLYREKVCKRFNTAINGSIILYGLIALELVVLDYYNIELKFIPRLIFTSMLVANIMLFLRQRMNNFLRLSKVSGNAIPFYTFFDAFFEYGIDMADSMNKYIKDTSKLVIREISNIKQSTDCFKYTINMLIPNIIYGETVDHIIKNNKLKVYEVKKTIKCAETDKALYDTSRLFLKQCPVVIALLHRLFINSIITKSEFIELIQMLEHKTFKSGYYLFYRRKVRLLFTIIFLSINIFTLYLVLR